MEARFSKLYSRRAMLHHYNQYMDVEAFEEAREDIVQLIEDYRGLERPTSSIPVPAGASEGQTFPLQISPLF